MSSGKDFKSDLIRNSFFKDGVIIGDVNFPVLKKIILVEIDPELGNPDLEDFNLLANKLKNFIKHFTTEYFDILVQDIATSVANNLFQQEGYSAGPNDFKVLKRTLNLEGITIFPEGYALKFTTEKFFPDYQLIVELTNDLEIDDMALYD